MTNWREAHASGKIWAKLRMSASRDPEKAPPLLGPCTIECTGAKDDDTCFRMFVLFTGAAKTGKEADALLRKAKKEHKRKEKERAVAAKGKCPKCKCPLSQPSRHAPRWRNCPGCGCDWQVA